MIRRSLEAPCDDRGVAQGTLRERFKSLADKQIIPPVLAEMGAALRLLGNVGAHQTEQEITIPQTWTIDKLFRAIIEYVYLAPQLLADFQATQKKEKTSQ